MGAASLSQTQTPQPSFSMARGSQRQEWGLDMLQKVGILYLHTKMQLIQLDPHPLNTGRTPHGWDIPEED